MPRHGGILAHKSSLGQKKYTIPRKQRRLSEDCQEVISSDSREAKDIETHIRRLTWEATDLDRSYIITKFSKVHNPDLERDYHLKRTELREDGRPAKELTEHLAFRVEYESCRVKEICVQGLCCDGEDHVLGDGSMGVSLWRCPDLCLRNMTWPASWTVFLIVFKIVKGRVKPVTPKLNEDGPNLEPTPHYDCHMSKNTPHSSVVDLPTLMTDTQYYCYEYDDEGFPRDRPRQCLPYAVVHLKKVATPKHRITLPCVTEWNPGTKPTPLMEVKTSYLGEDEGNIAWRGLVTNKECSLGLVALMSAHKLGLTMWKSYIDIRSKLSFESLMKVIPGDIRTAWDRPLTYRNHTFSLCTMKSSGPAEKFANFIKALSLKAKSAGVVPVDNSTMLFLVPSSQLAISLGVCESVEPWRMFCIVRRRQKSGTCLLQKPQKTIPSLNAHQPRLISPEDLNIHVEHIAKSPVPEMKISLPRHRATVSRSLSLDFVPGETSAHNSPGRLSRYMALRRNSDSFAVSALREVENESSAAPFSAGYEEESLDDISSSYEKNPMNSPGETCNVFREIGKMDDLEMRNIHETTTKKDVSLFKSKLEEVSLDLNTLSCKENPTTSLEVTSCVSPNVEQNAVHDSIFETNSLTSKSESPKENESNNRCVNSLLNLLNSRKTSFHRSLDNMLWCPPADGSSSRSHDVHCLQSLPESPRSKPTVDSNGELSKAALFQTQVTNTGLSKLKAAAINALSLRASDIHFTKKPSSTGVLKKDEIVAVFPAEVSSTELSTSFPGSDNLSSPLASKVLLLRLGNKSPPSSDTCSWKDRKVPEEVDPYISGLTGDSFSARSVTTDDLSPQPCGTPSSVLDSNVFPEYAETILESDQEVPDCANVSSLQAKAASSQKYVSAEISSVCSTSSSQSEPRCLKSTGAYIASKKKMPVEAAQTTGEMADNISKEVLAGNKVSSSRKLESSNLEKYGVSTRKNQDIPFLETKGDTSTAEVQPSRDGREDDTDLIHSDVKRTSSSGDVSDLNPRDKSVSSKAIYHELCEAKYDIETKNARMSWNSPKRDSGITRVDVVLKQKENTSQGVCKVDVTALRKEVVKRQVEDLKSTTVSSVHPEVETFQTGIISNVTDCFSSEASREPTIKTTQGKVVSQPPTGILEQTDRAGTESVNAFEAMGSTAEEEASSTIFKTRPFVSQIQHNYDTKQCPPHRSQEQLTDRSCYRNTYHKVYRSNNLSTGSRTVCHQHSESLPSTLSSVSKTNTEKTSVGDCPSNDFSSTVISSDDLSPVSYAKYWRHKRTLKKCFPLKEVTCAKKLRLSTGDCETADIDNESVNVKVRSASEEDSIEHSQISSVSEHSQIDLEIQSSVVEEMLLELPDLISSSGNLPGLTVPSSTQSLQGKYVFDKTTEAQLQPDRTLCQHKEKGPPREIGFGRNHAKASEAHGKESWWSEADSVCCSGNTSRTAFTESELPVKSQAKKWTTGLEVIEDTLKALEMETVNDFEMVEETVEAREEESSIVLLEKEKVTEVQVEEQKQMFQETHIKNDPKTHPVEDENKVVSIKGSLEEGNNNMGIVPVSLADVTGIYSTTDVSMKEVVTRTYIPIISSTSDVSTRTISPNNILNHSGHSGAALPPLRSTETLDSPSKSKSPASPLGGGAVSVSKADIAKSNGIVSQSNRISTTASLYTQVTARDSATKTEQGTITPNPTQSADLSTTQAKATLYNVSRKRSIDDCRYNRTALLPMPASKAQKLVNCHPRVYPPREPLTHSIKHCLPLRRDLGPGLLPHTVRTAFIPSLLPRRNEEWRPPYWNRVSPVTWSVLPRTVQWNQRYRPPPVRNVGWYYGDGEWRWRKS